jgi:proline iminopeptidase
MKKKILNFIKFTLVIIFVIFGFIILFPRSYQVPAIEKRVSTNYWDLINGSRIAYTLIQAKGEKKPYPIIFLQGGPGGPIYDRNIKTLSSLSEAGFDIYLYDQIGCGYSDRLKNIEGYSIERHKKDLEEIVRTIGTNKVILIGQSWGAILATEFIADKSDKVEKVIFTGPGYLLPINRSLEEIKGPDSLKLRNPQFTNSQGRKNIYNIRARFVEWCAKTFDWKLAPDKEMDEFETVLDHEMGKSTVCDTAMLGEIENNRSGFYSMVKTVQSFDNVEDIRPKLRNCKIPVLIMRGQCDGMKWGFVTEYLNLFSNHRLIIIPNAGHSISREQPELYIKNILDFLTQ